VASAGARVQHVRGTGVASAGAQVWQGAGAQVWQGAGAGAACGIDR